MLNYALMLLMTFFLWNEGIPIGRLHSSDTTDRSY